MSSVIQERLKRARKLIEEGDNFRIITHYDVDGVCSGGIVARYLLKRGKRFHISFFRNVEKDTILKIIQDEEYVIMTDLGSGLIDSLEGNVIVLDHHKPPGDNENIIHVNPHLDGYNGSHDACASTLSYMLADDPSMAKFFLAGVFGDKQHLGGFTGINREIFEKLGLMVEDVVVLHGNVVDSILYSTEPFFFGLSGNQEAIEEFLRKIKIPLTRDFEELSEKERTKLVSALTMNLLKHSKVSTIGRKIIDMDVSVDGTSIRYLTELIDSSARTDNQSIALSYVLGDESAKEKMEVLRKEYKSKVIEGIYSMLDNLFELSHLQYFFVNNSYLASSLATIGSLYILDDRKVTLGIYSDDMVHISARGTQKIVKRVHLGDLMRKLSQKFGGNGGGHDIAAGATIPKGTEENFIKELNTEIEKSLSS